MNNNLVNAVTQVDTAFKFIFGVSIIILFLITVVTLYFLYRYNKKRNPVPADIDGNMIAETIWIVVPCIIVAAMFWYGWVGFKALRDAPKDSYQVKVTARMWSWSFTYPNGKTSDKLYVPENTPVKLEMTSKDVIHSFYVPAFRIKMDTVPGMQTYTWFLSGKPAEYEIQCAEYCGTRHSYMLSKVEVVSKDKFDKWLNDTGQTASTGEGEKLYKKYGCADCHSMDGSVVVGPSLKDVYNRDVTVLVGGKEKTVKADDEYLKTSIYNPAADIVKGFDNVMPAFKDTMPEKDLEQIVDYLKGGGKTPAVTPEDGKKVAEREGCTGCHSTDGSVIVGPSFKGLMDSSVSVTKDGKKMKVTANVQYIIGSIKKPQEYIVEGFDGSMPAYDALSDADMKALVEYISSLK